MTETEPADGDLLNLMEDVRISVMERITFADELFWKNVKSEIENAKTLSTSGNKTDAGKT